MDSIPLLDIPRAVTWERPAVTSGMWVSVMLVGLRVVVLVPIVGLGALAVKASQHEARDLISRFRDEEWDVLAAEQRWCLESRWDRFVLMVTRGASGLCVVTVVGGIVAVSFADPLLITIGVEADSSLLREWLNAPAHSSFTIPLIDHEVHPLWLLDVGDVVASRGDRHCGPRRRVLPRVGGFFSRLLLVPCTGESLPFWLAAAWSS